MGAQGTTTIDFGAFPGSAQATVAVTGQAAILAGSLCQAEIWPVATADHSPDEHIVENLKITAGAATAGSGFTIYGECTLGRRVYGLWTVFWVWN